MPATADPTGTDRVSGASYDRAMPSPEPLSPDFRRLWTAFTVSAVGSAVGSGALPLVAVLVLDVSTFQVSLLAALSAVASAAIALPSARSSSSGGSDR